MTITHKVEIAFATDPDAVTPTWTDVTAFVWAAFGGQVVINRGRADQISSITPSQMTLTLDNHDGRFTAGYASGAYYPNVVLGKRIRVSTNAGAGFVERFDGYVNAWPVGWAPTGKYAEATITAIDRLARLGRQLSSDNLISTYYLQQSPSDYWMFADDAGTTTPYNRSGVGTQLKIGSPRSAVDGSSAVTFGAGTGPSYDGLSAVQVVNYAFGFRSTATYSFTETASLTLSCFVRCAKNAADPSPSVNIFNLEQSGSSSWLELGASGAGVWIAVAATSLGVTVIPTGTSNAYDGNTHHVCGVFQGLGAGLGGNVLLYVDGVLEASASISSAALAAGPITVPLQTMCESVDTAGSPSTYTFAHAAIFASALNSGQVLDLANSGLTAFSGEDSVARVSRIGALAGIIVTTGGPGTNSMSPLLDVSNADYLSLMSAAVDTEGGMLFTSTSGLVTMLSRHDQTSQIAHWTLTNGQYGTDLEFLLDDFGMVNDVTADRPGGNPIHQSNSASVTANGTYSQQKTLQTTSDLEVLDYVNWTLATSTPAPRCSQVTVNLLTQPALVSTWLGIELGDVIALTGLPLTAPASSVTMQLQGYTETIALDTYSVQMNTAPYLLGNVFVLNSATAGLLNGTYVLGY